MVRVAAPTLLASVGTAGAPVIRVALVVGAAVRAAGVGPKWAGESFVPLDMREAIDAGSSDLFDFSSPHVVVVQLVMKRQPRIPNVIIPSQSRVKVVSAPRLSFGDLVIGHAGVVVLFTAARAHGVVHIVALASLGFALLPLLPYGWIFAGSVKVGVVRLGGGGPLRWMPTRSVVGLLGGAGGGFVGAGLVSGPVGWVVAGAALGG